MAIKIKIQTVVYFAMIMFTITCIAIGIYAGIKYGISISDKFYNDYINQSCLCLKK